MLYPPAQCLMLWNKKCSKIMQNVQTLWYRPHPCVWCFDTQNVQTLCYSIHPSAWCYETKNVQKSCKMFKHYDIGPIHASDVLTRKMFKHYAIASNPVPDVMKHKMFKHHALKWKICFCTVSTRMNFSNIIEFWRSQPCAIFSIVPFLIMLSIIELK